jgi:CRISPR-associated protein Csx17
MTHIHNLYGCAPAPLAHYLKALGILRLVSEQADDSARGCWEGERFRLATRLDKSELDEFFLHRYAPTPLVAPWNKGSGFFYDGDPGLTPIAKATAPRFRRMAQGISASQELLADVLSADKAIRKLKGSGSKQLLAAADKQFKAAKGDLISQCALTWRGPHREWFSAAMVLEDDGRPRFPALLGTGGNDGRLDFTNNFMQRLGDVFELDDETGRPRDKANGWLSDALWLQATTGYQASSPVGQYLPGGAGGANSGNGPESDGFLNPFDFLLCLEGALLFAAHASRRLGTDRTSRAAAPFVVNAQGAGYNSAGAADESARGEQWMPLWSRPLLLVELRKILGDGRAQFGTRAVREPLDMARAIARMGTAKGIAEFQRYGYIERNGQSKFAVPLGRFRVSERIEPHLACLDDLDAWLPRLRRQARAAGAPARLKQVDRLVGDALFAVTQHPAEAARWQAVLRALSAVEGVMISGSGHRAGPIPPLRPEWVSAAHNGADDLSAREVRLALSFALQHWRGSRSDSDPVQPDTVRRHWLPLEAYGRRFATSGAGEKSRLSSKPEVVMTGRRGEDDAVSLLTRRLVEAAQHGDRRLPLAPEWRAAASRSDVAALLEGNVSLDRTLEIARAFMALDRRAWRAQPVNALPSASNEWPDDAWMVIRLALLPWAVEDRPTGPDPAIVRRLATGDTTTAFNVAIRRLQAIGIRPSVRVTPAEPNAKLWAAALAFPISRRTANSFLQRISPVDTTSVKEFV